MPLSPTKEQQAIIAHSDGPLLVIAGPGSGKTFTLVERIIHLIVHKGIAPERILVATFTEKAATELITRISHRLLAQNFVANLDTMYVGTLHSICLRILEEHREFTRLKKNFTLMDQFDQTYFFFQRLSAFEQEAPIALLAGRENISRWNKANLLCSWINKLSEEVISPEALLIDEDEVIQALGKWYILYQELLEKENLLDFSVIQLETLKLLENNPQSVLAPLQEKLQYLMIDEYQDTNTIQERILFTLLNEKQNICVVGDDDQGLYRFRGATIRNILEFPQKFSQGRCSVHSLTTNYRSDPAIIDYYNRWMSGAADNFSWKDAQGTNFRYAKDIVPPKGKTSFKNAVLKVSGTAHKENWHEEMLAFLQHMKKEHLEDWNQVAFLFHSVKGEKVKALANYLEENNIPVYAPRSDLYFEREEVQLLIGAFLFIFRVFAEIRSDWEKKYAALAIWDYYDLCLQGFAGHLRRQENKELRDWCLHRVREIETMRITNKPLDFAFAILFYELLQFPLFAKFLTLQESNKDERPARNMAIFSQLLVKFEYLHHIQVLHPDFLKKNVQDFFNHFLRYLHAGGMTEFEDSEEITPGGAVAFMTIHQSKGLEFPLTVIGSLHSVPRKQHTELDEILQQKYYSRTIFEPHERIKEFDFKRLYYTAFSRAKNLLVLTCQEEETKKGTLKVPSRYFWSFYENIPTWRKVDFSKASIDTVRPSNFKGRYSYTSHVLVYEGCPRQYQFFKHWEFIPVREAPMLFGQLVHQTIEDVHKAALRGTHENITPENIQLWFDVNYANLSHKERVYLTPIVREVAFKHVERYVERKGNTWDDIHSTEIDVSLVKEDYILVGKIDLIQGKGNTVEIVDFKATVKPNQYAERHILDRYKRQLDIYAHLVEERYGLEVSAMNLYYTGEEAGVPTYRFPFERKAVDNTIAEVDKVVSCMQGKEFAVNERNAKLCKECDIKAYCDRVSL